MKTFSIKILATVAFVLSLAACGLLGNPDEPFQPQNYTVSGKVEKGPFVSGSTITMQLLDANMEPTGSMYNTTIVDDEGSFTFGSKMFDTPYADLSANGYFFNEVRGELSTGTLNLRAIVDISDATTINVNILTHIKYQRVLNLVARGKSFQEANDQAQKELFGAFGLSQYAQVDASRLSIISGDEKAGVLIAISSLLLVERTEAELTEYLARLCREFAAEGKFSEATQEIIAEDLGELRYRLEDIARYIVERYADLGMEVSVPDLKCYFDWDGDGEVGEEGFGDTPSVGPSVENMLTNLYSDTYNNAGVPLLGADGAAVVASMALELTKSLSIYNHIQQLFHYNNEVGYLVQQNINPAQQNILNCWSSFYSSLNKALLLRYADEQQKNVYQGYCNLFSAMQYYYMTTMWGDVPYYPSYESFFAEMFEPRTDMHIILGEQMALALEAMECIPEEKKDESLKDIDSFFFVSKDVARVLIAEMAIARGDYHKAREMLDQVIRSGFYTLTDANFSDPFAIANIKNCDEVIFALDCTTTMQTRGDITIQSPLFIPVQTLTEVMLLYAEANYYMGDWARAHEALQTLAEAKGFTVNPDDIKQTITDARKQLLLYSVGNFAYMKRNGLFMQEYGVDEYYQLLPIPQDEVGMNPNMTQNPGY